MWKKKKKEKRRRRNHKQIANCRKAKLFAIFASFPRILFQFVKFSYFKMKCDE